MPIMGQINPFHITPYYFPKFHFYIIVKLRIISIQFLANLVYTNKSIGHSAENGQEWKHGHYIRSRHFNQF
jgi:hypothetical protein